MTDRKMLEMAARVAGVCLHPPGKLHTSYGNWGSDTTCTVCGKDPSATCWDPLADDGDALRLAGDLSFVVNIWNSARKTFAGYAESGEGRTEDHGSDPYAATRRAIVRAAAEIGKQMEETT